MSCIFMHFRNCGGQGPRSFCEVGWWVNRMICPAVVLCLHGVGTLLTASRVNHPRHVSTNRMLGLRGEKHSMVDVEQNVTIFRVYTKSQLFLPSCVVQQSSIPASTPVQSYTWLPSFLPRDLPYAAPQCLTWRVYLRASFLRAWTV